LTQRPVWERYLPLGVLVILGGAALLIILLLGALALMPALQTEQTVTVIIDGDAQTTTTRAATVADLLNELRVSLVEGDTISPALNSRLTQDLVIRITKARNITLTVDGQSRILRTHLTNPAAILESAGFTVGPRDEVVIDGTQAGRAQLESWPVPATGISLRRAQLVSVLDDGVTQQIETTAVTVGEALFDAGITLYLADVVSPDLNTPLTPDVRVTIERGRPLSIIADGVTVETRVRGTTVADALADAGLALVGQDYTIPEESSELRPGMVVRVIRVKEETLTEESTQPFERVLQPDAGLELDQRATVQTGQDGIVHTSILVRYENGVEVSREPVAELVVQEPRNEVIAYGTNVVLRTIDTPDGPRQYWRHIRMYATSYHPAALGGDSRTSIGETLRKGIIASDPDIIPYRSEVYVPGYGTGLMADTGPAHRPLFIDLGYSDDDFVSWSRYVDVYLLAPAPDPGRIQYLLPG
jgi:uncharacterized protein YabE (DUF348 family)